MSSIDEQNFKVPCYFIVFEVFLVTDLLVMFLAH